jgi:hypothetical protein
MRLRILILGLLPLLLGGCIALFFTARENKEALARMNEPDRALLFGYLDYSEAPYRPTYVLLQQVSPPTKKAYWRTSLSRDGLFHFDDLPLGAYQIYCFGRPSNNGDIRSCFPKLGRNQTAIKFEEPGVYALGTWKYLNIRKGEGFFKEQLFDLEEIDAPNTTYVLELLLPELKSTRWYEHVQWYLSEEEEP